MFGHIQTRQIMYLPPNPNLGRFYESQAWREVVFGFKHGNFKNPPKSYILEWLKKDRCLIFHIHILNLYKSCSNLGFDQDSNGQKIKKKQNEKPKYIVLLCHVVSKHSIW